MADERVVSTKLEQIEQYHGELKEKQQSLTRAELLTNTTEQRAVERMFENAIQRVPTSPNTLRRMTLIFQVLHPRKQFASSAKRRLSTRRR